MSNRLGKYELLELIGSGATSEVYRAVETFLGREVALKVLKPSLVADETSFQRFVREAQAAATLFHDHIATVLDMGEADGHYFIAMRYVNGQSLEKILRLNGALTLEETLKMSAQIGGALDYAHQQGFLHRDVKPSNILRDQNGSFWLTDFGLTKAMMSTGMTSHTGAVLGTPPYIAPEVWLGEEARQTTDQYALACVIYEALTGAVLFAGATPPAIMTNHVLKGPAGLLDKSSGIPESVKQVLRQALSTKPEERYPSVGEFSNMLQKTATVSSPAPSQPIQASPAPLSIPVENKPPVQQAAVQPVSPPAANVRADGAKPVNPAPLPAVGPAQPESGAPLPLEKSPKPGVNLEASQEKKTTPAQSIPNPPTPQSAVPTQPQPAVPTQTQPAKPTQAQPALPFQPTPTPQSSAGTTKEPSIKRKPTFLGIGCAGVTIVSCVVLGIIFFLVQSSLNGSSSRSNPPPTAAPANAGITEATNPPQSAPTTVIDSSTSSPDPTQTPISKPLESTALAEITDTPNSGPKRPAVCEAVVTETVANVRIGTDIRFGAMYYAHINERLAVVGINYNQTWLNVQIPENRTGWVSMSVVTCSCDLAALPILESAMIPTDAPILPSGKSKYP